MKKSVPQWSFDAGAVAGTTTGMLDLVDYVDGLPGLIPHPRPHRVPRGAPLVVEGWAVDPAGVQPVAAVRIVLDGARPLPARTGLVRRDVAACRPRTPETAGYRAVISTGDLRPGPHDVRADALAADGTWYAAGAAAFWIVPVAAPDLGPGAGAARIHADRPGVLSRAEPPPFEGPVPCGKFAAVTGWAVNEATQGGIAAAVACDAAGNRWTAPCDTVRDDAPHGPGTGACLGFEIVVPTGALGRGRHRLHIRGCDENGGLFAGGTEVTLDVAGPKRPFPPFPLERRQAAIAVAALSSLGPDQVLVEGWALTAAAQAAADVVVELEALRVALAPKRYPALAGFRRATPPAGLPAPPVEDAWFAVTIDTAALTPSSYAVSVAVIEDDRRTLARLRIGTLELPAATRSAR